MSFSNYKNQIFSVPQARFTEKNVTSQTGRVFIVTGGTSGVGLELAKILYGTGATIYITSRSEARGKESLDQIKAANPSTKTPGILKFMALDLNDLKSVKEAAESFKKQESKLDVLWNNAGTGGTLVKLGEKTAQGMETMMGRHAVATLLFSELLLPELRAAVDGSPAGSVRIIWTSSIAAEHNSPKNGVNFDNIEDGSRDRIQNYAASKAASWMLARHMARLYGNNDGILVLVQNPGNIKGGSYGGLPWIFMAIMNTLVLKETKLGAYTELYAGLSPEVTMKDSAGYIIPWGRVRPYEKSWRKDIVKALKTEEDGGLDYPKKLYGWCQEKIRMLA